MCLPVTIENIYGKLSGKWCYFVLNFGLTEAKLVILWLTHCLRIGSYWWNQTECLMLWLTVCSVTWNCQYVVQVRYKLGVIIL
jgi:hypothetical protein